MTSTASTPQQYMSELPEDRKAAMEQLRQTILENLPEGFEETIAYGMLGYVVPHRIFPAGYHCDPKQPLPFASIASQKNFIALYHMGLYMNAALLEWFTTEYPKYSKAKLDMGKSCIRFKKAEHIPYLLIAELMKKISVQDWINIYQQALKR